MIGGFSRPVKPNAIEEHHLWTLHQKRLRAVQSLRMYVTSCETGGLAVLWSQTAARDGSCGWGTRGG